MRMRHRHKQIKTTAPPTAQTWCSSSTQRRRTTRRTRTCSCVPSARSSRRYAGRRPRGHQDDQRVLSDKRTFDRQVRAALRGEEYLRRYLQCNQGIVANDTKKISTRSRRRLRDRLMRSRTSSRSDIIRALSNSSREEVQRGGRRVMYVFSDMIENSDHMSGRIFFTTPTPQLIRYLRKYGLLASLKGAEVHVFGVGRDGTPSRAPLNVAALQKIMEFWKAYFQASNAQSIEISPNIIVRRAALSGSEAAARRAPHRTSRRARARSSRAAARYFCGSYSVMPSCNTPAV